MEKHSRFASLNVPPGLYLLLIFLVPISMMFVYSFRAGISGVAHDTFTLANYHNL